jgi:Flp pilus assembly protein TadG
VYIQQNVFQPNASRQPTCRGRSKRTAVAVIEFALVAPIMFLLVLATFEFGRALMATELITEAARAGCRGYWDGNNTYWPGAIIEGTSSQQVTNAVLHYLTSIGVNGESVSVIVNQPDNGEVTVQVTVPATSITWVPNPLFIKGTLTGKFTLTQE